MNFLSHLKSLSTISSLKYITRPPTTKNILLNQKLYLSSATQPQRFSNRFKMSDVPMIWIDLEMTGLDLTKDKIIEVAAIITDKDLNVIAEGPNLIIHQPAEVMDNMNDWCKEHHGKCGLTTAVLASKLTIEEAEEQILSFVKKHVNKPKIAVLAGNSVHVDRSFLAIHMPRLIDHLHYRIIDVSTIKELARRWYPECLANAPTKKLAHRALEDVKESIIELRYYKKHFFLPLNESSYTL